MRRHYGLSRLACLYLGIVLLNVFAISLSCAAKITLSVWTKFDIDRPSDVVAIEAFEKAYPNIEIDLVGNRSRDHLMAAIAAGIPPDVSLIFAGYDVPKYAQQGLILPFDDYLAKTKMDLSKYAPGIIESWKYQGKTWTMTYDVDIHMMHWNKDVFARMGVDSARLPEDMAEFDVLSRRLTDVDPSGVINRMGFVPWQGDWLTWAAPWDVEWWDARTAIVTTDQNNAVRMFEWMGSYAERYGAGPIRALTGKIQGFQEGGALINEHVAMHLGGPWIATRLKRYAPNQEWGHGFLPRPPGGLTKSSAMNAVTFVIPSGAAHPEEAFKYIHFYCSPEQSLKDVRAGARDGMPVTIEAAHAFVRLAPEQQPIIEVLVGPNLKSQLPMLPNSLFYRDQLSWARDQVINSVLTPRDALQQVKQRVQIDLDEILGK